MSLVSIKKDFENLLETNDFLRLEADDDMASDLIKSTNILRDNIEKLETKMFLSGV